MAEAGQRRDGTLPGRSPSGRQVAVRVIHSHLAEDAEFRARFAHEVAAARKAGGMFIAPVVGAQLKGSRSVDRHRIHAGGRLSEPKVQCDGPLPETSVASLAAGLAEGLIAIHKNKLAASRCKSVPGGPSTSVVAMSPLDRSVADRAYFVIEPILPLVGRSPS